MATMPLVAGEPWKWAEQTSKNENDLYKLFLSQAWQADQNDLNRAQQNNTQQNQIAAQASEGALNRQGLDTRQNNLLSYYRDRDDMMMGGGAPPKLVEKMKEAMQFYMSRGVPQHVAAALVGNKVQESNIDYARTGDGGNSYGEFMFNRNGEAPGYEAWLGANGRTNDSTSQREYVLEQLQKGKFKGLYDRMVASNDPSVSAEMFSREYERPNPKYANNDKRRKYATQAFTLYGIRPPDANTQTADASTAAPNPGIAQPPAASGQQQSAPPAPQSNSGAKTMPDPNKPADKKPAVDGTIIEQRGDIIKYRKPDGSIGFKRVSNG